MNTGLSIDDFYLKDLAFNEEDIQFTYKLLVNRLSDPKTHIKYITNSVIPSLDMHITNLRTKFKYKKIATIKDIKVAFLYVDNKNFFGVFYDYSQLKKAFKKYPEILKLRNTFDISKHFLVLLRNLIPKGETFYAYINPKHTLSLNSCKKVYEHIADLYAFKNE
jgi:hypothetical protein